MRPCPWTTGAGRAEPSQAKQSCIGRLPKMSPGHRLRTGSVGEPTRLRFCSCCKPIMTASQHCTGMTLFNCQIMAPIISLAPNQAQLLVLKICQWSLSATGSRRCTLVLLLARIFIMLGLETLIRLFSTMFC